MKDIFNNTTTSFDNIASGINNASPKPAVTFGIKATSSMTAANDTPIGKLYITEKGLVLSGKLIAENRDSLADSFAPTGVLSSLTLDLSPQGELYIKNSTTNTRIGDLIAIGTGEGVKAIAAGDSFGLIKVDGTNITVKNVSASTVSGPITYANKKINLYPAGTTSSNGTVATLVTAATIVSDGLSVASANTLGGIKVDGTVFSLNNSNELQLSGYAVSGSGSNRSVTINGATAKLSASSIYLDGSNAYIGSSANDDNKIVKKSDLSGYATTGWTTSQLEDIHDEAVAAQNAANAAVLKWS